MKLEFHQLDRRYEHLRVRNPERQRRLLASLAASGQQTPIVVVAISEKPDRYLVIDGYKRVAALEQLARDTVEAVVWEMSEADALVLDRSMRFSEQETALEQMESDHVLKGSISCGYFLESVIVVEAAKYRPRDDAKVRRNVMSAD